MLAITSLRECYNRSRYVATRCMQPRKASCTTFKGACRKCALKISRIERELDSKGCAIKAKKSI